MLGHLFAAFPSSLVQIRKSLLGLTTNTLPHSSSLHGPVVLIHVKRGEGPVGRALIIIIGVSFSWDMTCLPLSQPRTSLLSLPHTTTEQNVSSGNPSFDFIFCDAPPLDIPWNVITQILVLAPDTDTIQKENNSGWKQKCQGTLERDQKPNNAGNLTSASSQLLDLRSVFPHG